LHAPLTHNTRSLDYEAFDFPSTDWMDTSSSEGEWEKGPWEEAGSAGAGSQQQQVGQQQGGRQQQGGGQQQWPGAEGTAPAGAEGKAAAGAGAAAPVPAPTSTFPVDPRMVDAVVLELEQDYINVSACFHVQARHAASTPNSLKQGMGARAPAIPPPCR